MTRQPPVVRTAVRSDTTEIAALLGRAFDSDPIWQWMFPDPARRVPRLTRTFDIVLRAVHLKHGATEVTGLDGRAEAAALWDPPGHWRISPATQFRQAVPLVRTYGTRLPAALRALGTIENEHPKEPHWYLAVLGTDPPAQGRGLGGALLRSRLARCDEARIPAYLESSKESNVPYYERFGFRVTKELPLPAGCPPCWLMWRDPA